MLVELRDYQVPNFIAKTFVSFVVKILPHIDMDIFELLNCMN